MPYQLSRETMSGTKISGGSKRQPSSTSPMRGNVKSKSRLQTKAQWKDNLRRGCLERAKNARRERLRSSRSGECDGGGGPSNDGRWGESVGDGGHGIGGAQRDGNVNTKRAREDDHSVWDINNVENCGIVDHTPVDDGFQAAANGNGENYDRAADFDVSEENVVNTARTLVEQELQRALTGLQHVRHVHPADGGIPWKKMHLHGEEQRGAAATVRDIEFTDGDGLAELREMEEEKQLVADEYEISQEEFVDLLNDVTEELQREDELLEEEIWEMERAEAMQRERLMHQIDDYDCWEELQQKSGPTAHISPSSDPISPLVMCPICNSSSLTETPHDGIKCTNAASVAGPDGCTFRLDVAHEGLTLNHLRDQLCSLFEEHSRVCSGMLQFRVEERACVRMLMAKCDSCLSDVVVL